MNIVIHPDISPIIAPIILLGIINIIVALTSFCNPFDIFNNNL